MEKSGIHSDINDAGESICSSQTVEECLQKGLLPLIEQIKAKKIPEIVDTFVARKPDRPGTPYAPRSIFQKIRDIGVTVIGGGQNRNTCG